jgi:hypothetical protein
VNNARGPIGGLLRAVDIVVNLTLFPPGCAQAAACMEVEVGSFSDPEGLQGLAHFLGELVALLLVSLIARL